MGLLVVKPQDLTPSTYISLAVVDRHR